ncbi:MAG: hypothetical protein LAO76_03335 [Acidobacteriia bacterium]|nr:hypothetical protein [Terriglobia bacterium]
MSYEDLDNGWTDSGDDGGIDGFYLLLDGKVVTEDPEFGSIRRSPHLELAIITAKHGEQFKQVPINNLISSLPDVLDLRKEGAELTYPFADAIIIRRRANYSNLLTSGRLRKAPHFTFV